MDSKKVHDIHLDESKTLLNKMRQLKP